MEKRDGDLVWKELMKERGGCGVVGVEGERGCRNEGERGCRNEGERGCGNEEERV